MTNNLANPNYETLQNRTAAQSLTQSEYFRLIASPERRAAIAALEAVQQPTDLHRLASETANNLESLSAPYPQAVEDLEVRLHHVHLPKLAAAGLVDYDPENNRIM